MADSGGFTDSDAGTVDADSYDGDAAADTDSGEDDEESTDSEQEIDAEEYICRGKSLIRKCKLLEARYSQIKRIHYDLRIAAIDSKRQQLMTPDSTLLESLMKSRKEAKDREVKIAMENRLLSEKLMKLREDTEIMLRRNAMECTVKLAAKRMRAKLLQELKMLEDEFINAVVEWEMFLKRHDQELQQNLQQDVSIYYADMPNSRIPSAEEIEERNANFRPGPRLVYSFSKRELQFKYDEICYLSLLEKYQKAYYSFNYAKLLGPSRR